jgi:hypothetical protein
MVVKAILVVHRYMGVVLGLLMTVWCLSGFVMMYQSYPATTPAEREAGLTALDLAGCCALGDVQLADDAPLMGVKVEMLDGSPVMRALGSDGPQTIDLMTGQKLGQLDEAAVRSVAQTFVFNNGYPGAISSAQVIKVDQWTVQQWQRFAPIWKVSFDGSRGMVVYVSGRTGEVVQDTSARERLLSWFGAIPHWLYPTILRQDGKLWTQVVIWLSAAGTFLTVTGLVVGFVKLNYRGKRLFPYRRPSWFLHHMFGVFAGVLVLTWVFSGLLTMSPWGLFESPSPVDLRSFGGRIVWSDARQLLEQAKGPAAQGDVVQIRAAPLFGQPYLIVKHRTGKEDRLGLAGEAPLTAGGLAAALAGAEGALKSARVEILDKEDSYYYSHHTKMELPVFRVTLTDPDRTRIYLDHRSGEIRQLADATSRRYRWLESGLHDMDFAFLRARPVWDIVVILLLAAVTVSCATGAWLSFSRVGRDAMSVARWMGRLGRRSPRTSGSPVEDEQPL